MLFEFLAKILQKVFAKQTIICYYLLSHFLMTKLFMAL